MSEMIDIRQLTKMINSTGQKTNNSIEVIPKTTSNNSNGIKAFVAVVILGVISYAVYNRFIKKPNLEKPTD